MLSLALTAGAVFCFQYAPVDKVADHPGKAAGKLSKPEAAAVPSDSVPSATTQPPATRLPGGTADPTGPGITSPGINMVATPHADGTFEVSETVIFREPRLTMDLTSPEIRYGGTNFAKVSPTADLVQVTAAGQPVLAGPIQGTQQVELPEATDRVELRYLLTDATVRSIPSVVGRALGLLSPLTATNDATLPVRLEVGGPSVRNLICPRLPPARRQCAASAGELGVAPRLPAKDAVVIVQYNLPKPS